MDPTAISTPRIDELLRALRAVEPQAFLVPPRIMRRVIRLHCHLGPLAAAIPHRKSYLIDGQTLANIVEPDELGLAPGEPFPPQVFLFALPSSDSADQPLDLLLRSYWRRLFHLRIHQTLESKRAMGALPAAEATERLRQLGANVMAEIRDVLDAEKFLLPPRDAWQVYVEFAAVYFELKFFAPPLVHDFFPGLVDRAAVDIMFALDFDAAELLAASQPPGAASAPGGEEWSLTHDLPESDWLAPDGQAKFDEEQSIPDPAEGAALARKAQRIITRAKKSEERDNLVRAARWYSLLINHFPAEYADPARTEAERLIVTLVAKLQQAIEFSPDEQPVWAAALSAALGRATTEKWTVEARLLYDLQSAVVDANREFYEVDLVEYALWFGRRPLRRHLPAQPLVRVCRHIRRAGMRLPALKISDAHRRSLREVLHAAEVRLEERLREHFRPRVAGCLAKIGLDPQTTTEVVARDKLVEEICDRIVDRGFLTLGDVRDRISANQLKLPDLSSFPEFWQGDQLLALDRELAIALDGVYRRGEFYMRWQQSFSSVFFGTRLGRFLTINLILPFGGAFVMLKGLVYLQHEFDHYVWQNLFPPAVVSVEEHHAPAGELISSSEHRVAAAIEQVREAADDGTPQVVVLEEEVAEDDTEAQIAHATHEADALRVHPLWVLGVGLFALGLFHLRFMRRWVSDFLWYVYLFIRGLFYDLPAAVIEHPIVRFLINSRPWIWVMRFGIEPALVTAIAWPAWRWWGYSPGMQRSASIVVFIFACVLLNSRPGRAVREILWDWLVHAWFRLIGDILPGLFRAVMEFFKGVIERVERMLYAGDEWLRFKTGESGLWLYIKPVLGVFWFYIHYVVRFCVVLLIEPQINPIKHFPVVTVSHKLLLPLTETFAWILQPFIGGINTARATAFAILGAIPGVFGYLVWELKENWRLYRANSSLELAPLVLGHHGETLPRFLKPGFHSGTVPKLYSRLRYVERKAYKSGDWRRPRKFREALHHVDIELESFFEREFLALLRKTRSWEGVELKSALVMLTTNTIQVTLPCPALGPQPVELAFQLEAGRIVASIRQAGWLDATTPAQRAVFKTALAGLYHLCGVQLVDEQMRACFPALDVRLEVRADGLAVRTLDEHRIEAIYPLHRERQLVPHSTSGRLLTEFPRLASAQLIFVENAIPRAAWTDYWEREQAGQSILDTPLINLPLLPGEGLSKAEATESPNRPATPEAESVSSG